MIYPAFLSIKEISIILLVIIVIFGPDKIPEIARGLGQAIRKLKGATEDIKQEIMKQVDDIEQESDLGKSVNNLDPTKEIEEIINEVNKTEMETKEILESGGSISRK